MVKVYPAGVLGEGKLYIEFNPVWQLVDIVFESVASHQARLLRNTRHRQSNDDRWEMVKLLVRQYLRLPDVGRRLKVMLNEDEDVEEHSDEHSDNPEEDEDSVQSDTVSNEESDEESDADENAQLPLAVEFEDGVDGNEDDDDDNDDDDEEDKGEEEEESDESDESDESNESEEEDASSPESSESDEREGGEENEEARLVRQLGPAPLRAGKRRREDEGYDMDGEEDGEEDGEDSP